METLKPALKPGVHKNVQIEEYHNDPAVSCTGIKRLLKSPLDYWAFSPHNPARKEQKVTSSLAAGSAFHTLLLEPETFSDRFKVKEGVQSSKVPGFVGEGDLKEMEAAVAAVRSLPNISKLFTDGEAEVTMVWDDPLTGVRCRCRHDYFRQSHGMTVDYKTIGDMAERDIDRQIVKYGYHVQAAFYLDGMKALGLGDHQDFVLVFQQRDYPHKVYATTLCDDTIDIGRECYQLALSKYRKAVEACGLEKPWPAYKDEVHIRTLGDIQMHAPAINYGYQPAQ